MIKVFEMFAGYGGASWGLKKANIEYECIGISEIDKYAIQCFNQNFPNVKNYGDCSKIKTEDLPNFDLLTGGFPCQDVSIAGNRDLSKGRTNLYLEVLRIAKDKKPKYMLLENVKGLLSMKINERSLQCKIISDLNKIGYDVCFKLLNSKDYGIPQNRERVWFVCKLGKWEFGEFMFPKKEKNIDIKNILEKKVDIKYFLTEKQSKKLIEYYNNHYQRKNNIEIFDLKKYKGEHNLRKYNDNIPCLMAKARNDETPIICDIGASKKFSSIKENISPTLKSSRCDYAIIDKGTLRRGEYGTGIKTDGTTFTLTSSSGNDLIVGCITEAQGRQGSSGEFLKMVSKIGRRLTPKECFRLMGFINDEINLDNISDSQLYKLAGNGWDINLASKLFKEMFKNDI